MRAGSKLLLACLVSLLLPGAAHARKADPPWQGGPDAEVFHAKATLLREQMQPGERFGEISIQERRTVEKNLEGMAEVFDRRGSMDRMSNEEQVYVINAQENINGLLTKNDGDRLVCRMEQRTGTNFKSKVCLTAREWADTSRRARETYQTEFFKGGGSQWAPGAGEK